MPASRFLTVSSTNVSIPFARTSFGTPRGSESPCQKRNGHARHARLLVAQDVGAPETRVFRMTAKSFVGDDRQRLKPTDNSEDQRTMCSAHARAYQTSNQRQESNMTLNSGFKLILAGLAGMPL